MSSGIYGIGGALDSAWLCLCGALVMPPALKSKACLCAGGESDPSQLVPEVHACWLCHVGDRLLPGQATCHAPCLSRPSKERVQCPYEELGERAPALFPCTGGKVQVTTC